MPILKRRQRWQPAEIITVFLYLDELSRSIQGTTLKRDNCYTCTSSAHYHARIEPRITRPKAWSLWQSHLNEQIEANIYWNYFKLDILTIIKSTVSINHYFSIKRTESSHP